MRKFLFIKKKIETQDINHFDISVLKLFNPVKKHKILLGLSYYLTYICALKIKADVAQLARAADL